MKPLYNRFEELPPSSISLGVSSREFSQNTLSDVKLVTRAIVVRLERQLRSIRAMLPQSDPRYSYNFSNIWIRSTVVHLDALSQGVYNHLYLEDVVTEPSDSKQSLQFKYLHCYHCNLDSVIHVLRSLSCSALSGLEIRDSIIEIEYFNVIGGINLSALTVNGLIAGEASRLISCDLLPIWDFVDFSELICQPSVIFRLLKMSRGISFLRLPEVGAVGHQLIAEIVRLQVSELTLKSRDFPLKAVIKGAVPSISVFVEGSE